MTNRITRQQQVAAVVSDEAECVLAASRLVRFEAAMLIKRRLGGNTIEILESQQALTSLFQYLIVAEKRLQRVMQLQAGVETDLPGIPVAVVDGPNN